MTKPRIAIVISHPIQHFTPMYASLAPNDRWSVKAFFASSMGLKPYFDVRFGTTVRRDNLNLDAVPHVFLNGGEAVPVTNAIDAPELERELAAYAPDAVIVYGYIQRYQRRAKAWARRHSKKDPLHRRHRAQATAPVVSRGDQVPVGPALPYRDMLAASRDAVQPLVKAGKTLDEVKAAKPTAAFDEKWGKAFVKPDLWVTTLYYAYGGKEPAAK